MTETAVYEHVARHLAQYHPDLIWHFDLAGVNNPSPATRALYSRLNRRGWPDLCIDEPVQLPSGSTFHGLRIEIKAPGTRLRKRNGEWASKHLSEQARQIDAHLAKGYYAAFAVGLEDTLTTLHQYLGHACEPDDQQF